MVMRGLFVCLAMAAMLSAEPPLAKPEVRNSLNGVEQALSDRLRTNEALSSMYVLWRPRGAYLDGYGAVFTVELNLVPMANISPFQKPYDDEQKRQLNVRKRQKLEDLTAQAREMLVEAASRLNVVPENEKVALVVTLFHYNWEDLSDLPSQLVVQAPRSVLLSSAAGRLGKPELKAQVQQQYF